MGDKRNFAALDWVVGEISETLKDAHQALEAFVEDPRDSTRIRFCLTHIHQVHGSLQMVEFHGASLLAEEMEQLAQALMDNQVTSVPEAQEVLMRSLLQLPIYLDRIRGQKEDNPGLVLPLLNDLRAVRNQSYLSETNLFAPNLQIVKELYGSRHPITQDKAKLAQVLKKLREMYQFAAASVLREIKVEENLNYLDKVFSRMEALTQGTACFPMWEVSAALIEGLLRGDIELSVAVRGLLRHLARELRVLGEKAPGALDFMPRENLLKNLLYYVARAESGGKKVNRVKQRYSLSEALLDGVSIGDEGSSDSLSAPDPEAIRSVVVALNDEINSIKNVLDLSLSGHGSPEDLKEVLPIVKRVADTLAVLGIGDLRKQVNIQAAMLEELSQQNSFDEARLLDVAGKIIEIEHRLEAIAKVVGTNRDLASVNEREVEIDQAKVTVLKECQHGLEQAKDAIVEYISSKWDKSHLLNVGSLLHNIRGGLDMIPLPRPAAILGSCSLYIQEQLLNREGQPGWEALDTLADAIASLEYYLERLLGDMEEDTESLLDVAESSVATLGYPIDGSGVTANAPVDTVEPPQVDEIQEIIAAPPAPTEESVFTAEPVTEEPTAEEPMAEELPVSGAAPELEVLDGQTAPVASVEEFTAPAEVSLAQISIDDDAEESDIDDEIIEIFIEEAGEVKETLDEYVPQWKANQQDQDALVVIRRAFHTLKGSGRMVEAFDIGELAWTIENMLNRILDNSIRAEAAHSHVIDLAINLLPSMIDDFAAKRRCSQKALAEQYMAWAKSLSEGKTPPELAAVPAGESIPLPDLNAQAPAAEPVSESNPVVAETEEPQAELEDDEDFVLLEIFSSEAAGHLATMEAFIAQMEEESPLYGPPSDDFQRALHTLKGSAKMAQVLPIAGIAEPLEAFAKELITYQVDINADILQLYRDAVSYTREALGRIDARRTLEIPKQEQFVARTAELRELAVGHLIRLKEMEKDGQQKVDPRLLSIFMAEEMNLLLDAEQIIGDWQASGDSRGHIEPVVRELSTLGTGAQQANLPDMAGLSAQLCKLYEQYQAGQLEANDDFFTLLGAGHNALLDMVDAVAAGQNVVPPSEETTSALASLIYSGSRVTERTDDVSGAETEIITTDEPFSVSEEAENEISSLGEEAVEEAILNSIVEEIVEPEQLWGESAVEAEEESPLELEFGDDEPLQPGEDADELLDEEQSFSSDEHTSEQQMVDGFVEGADGIVTEELEDVLVVAEELAPTEELPDEEHGLSSEDHSSGLKVANGFVEDAGSIVTDGSEDLFVVENLVSGEEQGSLDTIEALPDEEHGLSSDDNSSELQMANGFVEGTDGSEDLLVTEALVVDPAPTEEQDLLGTTEEQGASESDAVVEFEPEEPAFVSPNTPESQPAAEVEPEVTPSWKTIPGLLDNIDTSHEDYDEDIVDIFLEEANELIEELDESVHSWESDWSDDSRPEQIKRVLHTLKGGARLAGMANLGELTHEYESFLIATDLSDLNDGFFHKMHSYQDRVLSGVRGIENFVAQGGASATAAPAEISGDAELDAPIAQTEGIADQQPENSAAEAGQESNVLPFMPRPKSAAEASPGEFNMPAVKTGGGEQALVSKQTGPQEVVKVSSDLLEELVNLAGETSINRSRIEQQVSDFSHSLEDIDSTIARLQEQLRRLDIETEAQVLFRQEQMAEHEDFDPLEMDRYSQLQQLSRSLIESASDLVDLRQTLTDNIRDTETLLLQQSRINTTLQEGLMRSRMVPFSRLVPRLRRIVRQVAGELGKNVSFELDNIEGELDRSVLERLVPPLEHMLRNAVDHGIELPEKRIDAAKPETGRIVLTLGREGGDVLLRLADDGRGVDLRRVREKAIERGLMAADAELSDFDIMQFVLHAGFSTAETVTQISGRGVGMDVVTSEIKAMGGSVLINSEWGRGTEVIIRLPFTVSVNRALMVEIGLDNYAIPLNTIEGIVRVSPFELEHYYSSEDARFEYAGENYQVRYLGTMLNADIQAKLEGQALPLPVLLVRSAESTMAIQVDNLLGSREVVVKSLGSQFSSVQGLSGATLMGDGSVVVILDPHALVRKEIANANIIELDGVAALKADEVPEEVVKTIMVVDDSVTVRKVTSRFLEREGFNVMTAKDGVDALRTLQDELPDLMLLDIEMPRMDGFEVAKNIRTTSRWKHLPIIMITSRTGDKHREHAMELGVNKYMGKPYQEDMLLEGINDLLAKAEKG
ncbi:Hpt domain-containing protein [Teredinibacter haidensis]|uniref:hybrid sensor histidine kinase/response regulator n=1 Tax=Teredinibacter haidensis TaxID=2731755 RepID=UPI000948B11E|nr:Hpt domain-containing protein [Teredinibacter haidensis]